jgi:hypothetical protein
VVDTVRSAAQYQLNAMRSVRIDGLRIPFPSYWCAVRGTQRLSTSNDIRLSTHPDAFVRAEQLFAIHMTPDSSGAVTINLTIDIGPSRSRLEPDWDQLRRAYLYGRDFGPALVQSMFQMPRYAWRLGEVAAALEAPPRSLQMTLFREGYSFDAALRRCRRLHMLLEAGNEVVGLKIERRRMELSADLPGIS